MAKKSKKLVKFAEFSKFLDQIIQAAHWDSQLSYHINPNFENFLTYGGSSTEYFRQLPKSNLAIQVLNNFINPDQNIQRDILLSCFDSPWMLARSLMANNNSEFARSFYHLGDRSLGEWIFSYPEISRSKFEFACVKLADNFPYFYARKSVFTLGNQNIENQSLLLFEIFLPKFIEYLINHHENIPRVI